MPHLKKTLAERLARRIWAEPATGCRVWVGAKNTKGYGRIRVGGKTMMAHRAAYELERGSIPEGLQLDHLCRNRRCCNPDHLEPVTREENIARGGWQTVLNARKTLCKWGHEFTPENTYYRRGGGRDCKACRVDARKREGARRIIRRGAAKNQELSAENRELMTRVIGCVPATVNRHELNALLNAARDQPPPSNPNQGKADA
jgi:hypothetical protein